MIKDIIGLRAAIKLEHDEAVEMEEAAAFAHQEAVRHREKLKEFLDIVENYRGGGGERRNVSRLYNTPGSGSKASEIETIVLGVVAAGEKPLRSEDILDAMVKAGHADLLPGDDRSLKSARLSTYLTRMHRRDGASLHYDRDNRTYGLVDGNG